MTSRVVPVRLRGRPSAIHEFHCGRSRARHAGRTPPALTRAIPPAAPHAATNYLADNEATPGFTVALMRLADADTADHNVRLQAAAHLKNVIRRNWNVRAFLCCCQQACRAEPS